jgi:hypothetical protein
MPLTRNELALSTAEIFQKQNSSNSDYAELQKAVESGLQKDISENQESTTESVEMDRVLVIAGFTIQLAAFVIDRYKDYKDQKLSKEQTKEQTKEQEKNEMLTIIYQDSPYGNSISDEIKLKIIEIQVDKIIESD